MKEKRGKEAVLLIALKNGPLKKERKRKKERKEERKKKQSSFNKVQNKK